MPNPKELSECEHPWYSVVQVEQKTVIGEMDMIIDVTDVHFCDDCESVLEEV